MSLEELRKDFIVDADTLNDRLAPVVQQAKKHCVIDPNGRVHVTNAGLSGANQVMLVLAARNLASYLEPKIKAEVTVDEIHLSTGLPENQIRARVTDWIKRKFADSPTRGIYRAVPHKIQTFVESLATKEKSGTVREGTT